MLCYSCNRYCAESASDRTWFGGHRESFPAWARRLGIGVSTGVDFPSASRGWYPAEIQPGLVRQLAIGQSMTATPLQMARLAALIANGRMLPFPRIAAMVGDEIVRDGGVDVDLEPAALAKVREGMRACAEVGTARKAFGGVPALAGVTVYGKTGTATARGTDWVADETLVEGYKGPWHLWFVGYAVKPGTPTIAFACVLHSRKGKETGGRSRGAGRGEIPRLVVRAMTLPERFKRANWPLLLLGIVLTIAGISSIDSASDGRVTPFVRLQVRWAVLGVALALALVALPSKRVIQAGYVLYALGLAGLVLVLFVGTGKGVGRWISLGRFRVQPSEFMKLMLIIALAGHIRYERDHKRLEGLLWPVALTVVPFLLVMLQPDLGTALLFVPLLFATLFAAGARIRHLGLVTLAGLLAAGAIYFVPGVLKPYQRARITTFASRLFADESAGPRRPSARDHQLDRSVRAAGVGGWAGVSEEDGAAGQAARGVPERHTDFVFPVFASRYGFVGVTLLYLVYLLFLGSLLGQANRTRDPSARLLAVGVFTLFAAQLVVNTAMTVGLLPIVGVPLPFFSYGGSSLLVSFAALGLALSVGVDPELDFGRDPFAD